MTGAVLDCDVDAPIGLRTTSEASQTQIVTFRLGREDHGIEIMHVQEIILLGQITRIPNVPEYVTGLINLRGHVIPVIDLRKRFALSEQSITEHSRIIVLNVHTRTMGVIVDSVNQVLRVARNQIEPPPQSVNLLVRAYLSGLVKLREKILFLLNVEYLAEDVREHGREG